MHIVSAIKAQHITIGDSKYSMNILDTSWDECSNLIFDFKHSNEYKSLLSRKKECEETMKKAKSAYNRLKKNRDPDTFRGIDRYRTRIIDNANDALSHIHSLQADLERNREVVSFLNNVLSLVSSLQHAGANKVSASEGRIRSIASTPKDQFERVLDIKDAEQRSLILKKLEQITSDFNCYARMVMEKRQPLLVQREREMAFAIGEYAKAAAAYEQLITEKFGEIFERREKIITLIRSDPDLTPDTVQAIIKCVPAQFEESDWDLDMVGRGATLATISMDIKRDENQTTAELVAAVADSKRTSFVDSMVHLIPLKEKLQLFYYSHNNDGSISRNIWIPRFASEPRCQITSPDAAKASNF